jgi:hypothetical protein
MPTLVYSNTSGVGENSGQSIISQSCTPIGIAPTGSIGANGALTLGTALNAAFTSGLYLYFPAGAAFSGSSAGYFWCVMSTTTLGTVFNNQPGNEPTPPEAATAIVDAGPGAYTGSLVTQTAVTIPVPGKLLGRNGQLLFNQEFIYNNSAGSKVCVNSFGGVTLATSIRTTSTRDTFTSRYRNLGAETVGLYAGNSESTTATVATITPSSIDTRSQQNLLFRLQSATVATDYIILLNYSVMALPSYL